MTKKNRILSFRTYERICLLLLTALAAVFVWANLFRYTRFMDSDIGAEALLAKRIAESGFLTPATWKSSTEIRVVSTPNLAAFFYSPSGSMNLSMGIACSAFFLLLLLAMRRCFRNAGLSRAAVLTAMLLPLSLAGDVHDALEMFALYACYYGGHIAALFYTSDVYGAAVRKTGGRKLYLRMAVCVLLAFLMGRQGMRGVLIIYAPLAAAEALRLVCGAADVLRPHGGARKDMGSAPGSAKQAAVPLWVFGCAALSYVTAGISVPFGTGISRNVRRGPEKLVRTVLPQIAGEFGTIMENTGAAAVPVTAAAAALAAAGIAGYLWLFAARYRAKEETGEKQALPDVWRLLPVLLSFLTAAAAGAFTTIDSTGRYYVMALFAAGAGAGVLLDFLRGTVHEKTGGAAAALMCLILFAGMHAAVADAFTLIAGQTEAETQDAALSGYLIEKGFDHGYASFDHANRLTAAGDCAVQIASVEPETLEATRWLSDASWYPPLRKETEKSFFVATEATEEAFRAALENRGVFDYRTDSFGRYRIFFLDRDVTVWRE